MSDARKDREIALSRWAHEVLMAQGIDPGTSFSIEPASDDASFRRYFRGHGAGSSYIFVDAPPDKEDSHPFVQVAELLRGANLKAPRVYASDLGQGFMMLTDLGDYLYLDALASKDARVEQLYDDALRAIAVMQGKVDAGGLPAYDESLLRQEMNLFVDWFLPRQIDVETTSAEQDIIEEVFQRLVESATEQPQVFVHRDYHSRNLMVVDDTNPGIIDFQDAVRGPVTYDLVSLMKDCYYRFPADMVAESVQRLYELLRENGVLDPVGPDQFVRWFDLMGMQRHIKVAGIFSRLNLRDGKPGYLADIPLVVDYIVDVCERYPEFDRFHAFLNECVLPKMGRLAKLS